MKIPYSGGCACGAIRYKGAQAPLVMINCHCTDCQRSSGAPFASGIVVMTADLQVSGTPKTYAVRGSSGASATRSFCADCGTPLFTQSEANAQFTSIRFPSLDDASDFKPMLDIYTASAQQWLCLDPAIPHFPQSPQQPDE
ncbi:GFA family protein [Massilia niabensis]|uniref:GFA family protein n=1 Tax=Massilia niabensis TaxID=544910 RepID=A0ABW0L641_9BURK